MNRTLLLLLAISVVGCEEQPTSQTPVIIQPNTVFNTPEGPVTWSQIMVTVSNIHCTALDAKLLADQHKMQLDLLWGKMNAMRVPNRFDDSTKTALIGLSTSTNWSPMKEYLITFTTQHKEANPTDIVEAERAEWERNGTMLTFYDAHGVIVGQYPREHVSGFRTLPPTK
jgi:hypothetical protein